MIKLIASDIDGTLVPESCCTINPEFYEIIRELKKQGIVFAAASGRQYKSMLTILEPVKNDIIFISGNGTRVLYKDEELDSLSMDRKSVEEAVKYIRTLPDCFFTISASGRIYGEKYDEEFLRLMLEGYHNEFYGVEDVLKEPLEIQKMGVYKRCGVKDIQDEVIRALQDKFRVFQAGTNWVDIVPYEADKGKALAKLQKKLGITQEETMAFGDNYNDIGMLRAAGESYAVANAQEEVKKAARHIADSYETEGVIRILKSLLK